jgi:hypothetical protein
LEILSTIYQQDFKTVGLIDTYKMWFKSIFSSELSASTAQYICSLFEGPIDKEIIESIVRKIP